MPHPSPDLPVGVEVVPVVASRPARQDIAGRFVTLTPLLSRHAEDLYALSHGPEQDALWAYLPVGPFSERADFDAHVARCAASEDPLFFAILDNATGKAVGHASYLRIDVAQRSIEVGFILYTPALQRKPGATEAMYLMARHAFELGYRRYEWKCNALNAPSMRAAKRFGFTYEGIFRQHMIVKSRNRDTAWFSLLDHEWPARKAAYEAWLAPDNFDDDGMQKQGLMELMARGGAVLLDTMRIRRAIASDAQGLTQMQAEAYRRNAALIGKVPIPLEWDYAERIANDETWVVDGKSGIEAALILQLRTDDFYIDNVSVHPAAQGIGVGRALMAFAENRARAEGRATIRLLTNEKVAHNVAWYERSGYAIENVEVQPDRRIVHMVKTLQAETRI